MRYMKKSLVCGNSSIFSNMADGAILTSASSLQSSFSSNSCQFQSISTFFLCDWMTSFWILFALSFLFLSSSVRRVLSYSSVSVLILIMRSSVLRRTCSKMPIVLRKTASIRASLRWNMKVTYPWHPRFFRHRRREFSLAPGRASYPSSWCLCVKRLWVGTFRLVEFK